MIDSKVIDACGLVSLPVAADDAEWLVAALKALADPTRLHIVQLLATAGETCVCNLPQRVGIAQNLLSHHLRVLRDAGLVHARKRGRWVDYRVDAGALARLQLGIPQPRALSKGA